MSNLDPKDRLIVALDAPTLEIAEEWLIELKGVVHYYKVGLELFTAHGWKAVNLVKNYGGRVFLDLKLHDIPNTVSRTLAAVCEHEVDIVNVHALGGFEMMKMAREAVDGSWKAILTSDNPRFEEPQDILNDMIAGLDVTQKAKSLTIVDRREAIKTACALAQPGDVVLIAGKGHEDYQIIQGVKHHFDDREEVRNCF